MISRYFTSKKQLMIYKFFKTIYILILYLKKEKEKGFLD